MTKTLTALAFTSLLLAGGAACAADGMVSVPSKYSVAETMDRLEAAIRRAQPPINVFARVDFQATAATQGGKLRPTQILIFGRGGTAAGLVPQHPRVAIDLPLKALAWEDEQGKSWLTYNTGEYLAQRHGVTGRDDFMKRVTDFTAGLVKSPLNDSAHRDAALTPNRVLEQTVQQRRFACCCPPAQHGS